MLKKMLMIGILAFMVFTLGACGNGESPVEGSQSNSEKTDADSESAVLIAYFSWSGNTKQLAEMIQDSAGQNRKPTSKKSEIPGH